MTNQIDNYENLKEGSPCPYCGQPLVLRHSSHGDFLGCSDYPLCSFLKPVAATHPFPDAISQPSKVPVKAGIR